MNNIKKLKVITDEILNRYNIEHSEIFRMILDKELLINGTMEFNEKMLEKVKIKKKAFKKEIKKFKKQIKENYIMSTKYINIKEFREKGYLQELNRRFLHPLGLALEIIQEDDGSMRIGGIWDYREKSEGIYYDINNPKFSDDKRKKEFLRKKTFIDNELKNRKKLRMDKLGFIIETLKENSSKKK